MYSAAGFVMDSLDVTLARPSPSCPVQARHRLNGSAFSHGGEKAFVDVTGRRQRLSEIKAVAVGEALVERVPPPAMGVGAAEVASM